MTRQIPWIALLLLLPLCSGAQSQNQPPSLTGAGQQANLAGQQNPRPLTATSRIVIVPVTVKDSHGQLVAGLQRSDFRVFSDNLEQKIASFSGEAVPLSSVVLIDNDLAQKVSDQVQKSLIAISAGFGPADEVAVVTYEQFPLTVSDFSSDNDLLFTKLKRLELGSHDGMVVADPTTAGPVVTTQPAPPPAGGGVQVHGSQRYKTTNALNDAIFAATEMLKTRGRDRRKIIFLISDGTNAQNQHTYDQTLRNLLISDVSVYSISVTHSLPVGRSLLQRGAAELEDYAHATGGDTYFGDKQADLDRLYSNVTEEARNQYTLTFYAPDSATSQDFHSIEVRVERPDLTVTTRDGYYLSAIGTGH